MRQPTSTSVPSIALRAGGCWRATAAAPHRGDAGRPRDRHGRAATPGAPAERSHGTAAPTAPSATSRSSHGCSVLNEARMPLRSSFPAGPRTGQDAVENLRRTQREPDPGMDKDVARLDRMQGERHDVLGEGRRRHAATVTSTPPWERCKPTGRSASADTVRYLKPGRASSRRHRGLERCGRPTASCGAESGWGTVPGRFEHRSSVRLMARASGATRWCQRALPRRSGVAGQAPRPHHGCRAVRAGRCVLASRGSSVRRPAALVVRGQPRSTRWPTISGARELCARAVAALVGGGQVARARRCGVAAAGRGPTQASTSRVSPLRNRWARTPPVARPFAGYCANGVTFTVAAGRGDHHRLAVLRVVGADRAEERPPGRPSARLMPAMPPPLRPCGRTSLAGEPQQRRVGGDERQGLGAVGQPGRADHLVAVARG